MAYGGKFTSREDLSGNRQALQVGRDYKPLEGADAFWAEMAGMNDDGSWNEWGQARTQILSWLTGNAPMGSYQNAQRDSIMSRRQDDYGRAYDQYGSQLIGDSQRAMWNTDVEGGKATGQIIGMVAGAGAGGGMSALEGELGNPLSAENPLAENFIGPPEGNPGGEEFSTFPGGDANVVDATGYGLSEQDQAALAERGLAKNLMGKAQSTFMGGTTPVDLSLKQSQKGMQNDYANGRGQQNLADIQSKQADMAWADSVPVVGSFIGSIHDQNVGNDIWAATMEDAISRLDRSLMLDESEYMG